MKRLCTQGWNKMWTHMWAKGVAANARNVIIFQPNFPLDFLLEHRTAGSNSWCLQLRRGGVPVLSTSHRLLQWILIGSLNLVIPSVSPFQFLGNWDRHRKTLDTFPRLAGIQLHQLQNLFYSTWFTVGPLQIALTNETYWEIGCEAEETVITCTQCSSRGPKISSQHPFQAAHNSLTL